MFTCLGGGTGYGAICRSAPANRHQVERPRMRIMHAEIYVKGDAINGHGEAVQGFAKPALAEMPAGHR